LAIVPVIGGLAARGASGLLEKPTVWKSPLYFFSQIWVDRYAGCC
jgi:hypothetical protein